MAKSNSTATSGKVIKIDLTEEERNNKELAKGRITEYSVPPGEEDAIHVEIEKTEFSSVGKKKSVPTVQKFDQRAWLNFRKHCSGLGYNHVRIIYAPEEIAPEFLAIVPLNTENPNK